MKRTKEKPSRRVRAERAAPREDLPIALRLGLPLAVGFVAFVAFLPALATGFVNLDDETNFVRNSHYRGLSSSHLAWMFTTFHMGHYQPLSWVTLGVDHAISGMNPRGYHLTNLLLHAGNAALLFFVALALLRKGTARRGAVLRLAAAASALVFAIHPLRVESVAWVTERRDVLATFFYLLALLAWFRWTEKGTKGWYAASVAACVLSILSKAWAVTFFVLLLLVDVHPLRRFSHESRGRLLLEKVPFLLLALAALVWSAKAQEHAEAVRSWTEHTLLDRTVQAGYGLCFYLGKMLLPIRLSPLYPLRSSFDPWEPRFLLSCVLAIAITVALFLLRRRFPALLVSWLTYVVIVSPVLGFFQAGPQIAADRYTYLACMPFAVLLGAALLRLQEGRANQVLLPAVLLLFAGLFFLTWRQTTHWRDSVSLWQHAITIVPNSYFAQYNLGKALLDSKRAAESIPHFESALVASDPRDKEAAMKMLQDAGAAYGKAGKLEPAMEKWNAILAIEPDHLDALFSLGLASMNRGRYGDAVSWFERTIESEGRFTRKHPKLFEHYRARGGEAQTRSLLQKARESLPSPR